MESRFPLQIAMSKLERRWWFYVPVTLISVGCTFALLIQAGMPVPPVNISQWLVWALCVVSIQRGLSLAGRALALWLWPAAAKGVV